jgi:UDP-glucose 4-epimerase
MTTRQLSCVVLGGGGFIGINLCRRLASSGHRVRAFGRRCLFKDALDGIEWYQGDFSNVTSVAAGVQNYDVVFHLIHDATPQSANLDMIGDLRRNVGAALALLDICRNLGTKRVVFVSSGGTIYGPTAQLPIAETAPTDPITAYGVGKLAIEKYLAMYQRLFGLDYRILRVANPFGPYQVPLKNQGIVATLISRAMKGEAIEIWGDGSIVRDYIYIDDVAAALERAMMDESDQRIFNIGSGRGRSLLQVIDEVESLFGTKLKIEWRSDRPIDVPASVLAIERARSVLGWEPRADFRGGLQKTRIWWEAMLAGNRRIEG